MTRDYLAAMLPVITAFVNGEPVQKKILGEGWVDVLNLQLDSHQNCYRIAPEQPEPKYIPWTLDTVPMGAVIVRKDASEKLLIDCAGPHYAAGISYRAILDGYTMLDGAPCGTLVQEDGK